MRRCRPSKKLLLPPPPLLPPPLLLLLLLPPLLPPPPFLLLPPLRRRRLRPPHLLQPPPQQALQRSARKTIETESPACLPPRRGGGSCTIPSCTPFGDRRTRDQRFPLPPVADQVSFRLRRRASSRGCGDPFRLPPLPTHRLPLRRLSRLPTLLLLRLSPTCRALPPQSRRFLRPLQPLRPTASSSSGRSSTGRSWSASKSTAFSRRSARFSPPLARRRPRELPGSSCSASPTCARAAGTPFPAWAQAM